MVAPLAEEEFLRISGLATYFQTRDGCVRSVDGLDLALKRGETVAIVGESGSGKSVTCLSIMRLLQHPGRIEAGSILFRDKAGVVHDLASVDEGVMRHIRGDDIAMIFQEPMTSLNPLFTAGDQVAEAIQEHRGVSRAEAWKLATDMLRLVGIADPDQRMKSYPHQMSGGMRQRVMIAMALACAPKLLIADEPTTALDVTIQAQILDLLRDLRDTKVGGMSILFVTHNMGVVAEMADRLVVMYAGRAVESGAVREVFRHPRHPYTRGLLGSMAVRQSFVRRGGRREPLLAIQGNVPDPHDMPDGCAFAPRCDFAEPRCSEAMPILEAVSPQHETRCLRWREL